MGMLLEWEFCWNGNAGEMGTVLEWELCWNGNSAQPSASPDSAELSLARLPRAGVMFIRVLF